MQLPVRTLSSRPEAKLFPHVPRFAHNLTFRGRDGAPFCVTLMEALGLHGTGLSFRRWQRLFAEGEFASRWYWLATGATWIRTLPKNHRHHVAELVFPGNFFALKTCKSRGATAGAARGAVLTVYPRVRAEAVINADPMPGTGIPANHLLAHARGAGAPSQDWANQRLGAGKVFLPEMPNRCQSSADQSLELPVTRGATTLLARQSIRLTPCTALGDGRPNVRLHASDPILRMHWKNPR